MMIHDGNDDGKVTVWNRAFSIVNTFILSTYKTILCKYSLLDWQYFKCTTFTCNRVPPLIASTLKILAVFHLVFQQASPVIQHVQYQTLEVAQPNCAH